MKNLRWLSLNFLFLFLCVVVGATAGELKMIGYSAYPNGYLTDHAKEIAKIYDGFFFSIGSWDSGTLRCLGLEGQPAQDAHWYKTAGKNITALNRAGVSENFLTVCFGQDEEWPSPTTLFSDAFIQKMESHYRAIGRSARALGCRGVCIDVEYPYQRYSVSHPIYRYDRHTVYDLETAARDQGRLCVQAILQQFPEAVIITLPGQLRSRLIDRNFQYGMLEYMAEVNAPGGFHLGTEYTYSLNDPVSTLITPRFEDAGIKLFMSEAMQNYWKAKCTIAPGVWPLHMVETGGKDYPVRPWKEEVAELKEQMSILRSVSKRYIWSYSGAPVWYLPSAALEKKYGLAKQTFSQPDIDLAEWHNILMDKSCQPPAALAPLRTKIAQYDAGKLSAEELCDAFGVAGHWWVLGLLANPHQKPQYAAAQAAWQPFNPQELFHGRDQVVRWFDYALLDPRGIVNCARTFDWRNTDSSSAHFVAFIHSPKQQQAVLQVGWDDGLLIRFNDQVVFDRTSYPPRGRGQQYRDRYAFEEQVPVALQQGANKLAVTSINSHGSWIFALRLTDEQGIPLQGVVFRLNE
ncbi:MAG TPA: hypothetical protein PK843_00740 [bacterium]|nr:hypothetical protein [bacterium]